MPQSVSLCSYTTLVAAHGSSEAAATFFCSQGGKNSQVAESQGCGGRASAVVVWGTGKPTREFLYVEDAAEGIILAADRHNHRDPVNLGSGIEISMSELAELIARLTGLAGDIVWHTSEPDGQPRRKLDISKAERLFGFVAKKPLKEGLRRTIESHQAHRTARACEF